MNDNIKTINELAGMVARGFSAIEEKMATKEDLERMATKEDLANLRNEIDIMLDRHIGTFRKPPHLSVY